MEFKRKEAFDKAVRRVGRRLLSQALNEMEERDPVEGLHEVRKRIKQARALLRLVRPALSKPDYKRCAKRLRNAASLLSAARDARVRLDVLNGLVGRFKHKLPRRELAPLLGILAQKRREDETALISGKRIPQARRSLAKACKQVSSMHLQKSGWAAVGPGIKKSYRRGQRAFGLVNRHPTGERYHECRKRVKDLYYQLGLFARTDAKSVLRAIHVLDRMGDGLGQDHDLLLLREPGLIEQGFYRTKGQKKLVNVIECRQRELKSEALRLAADFYERTPSAFCNDLRKTWKHWRDSAKSNAHH